MVEKRLNKTVERELRKDLSQSLEERGRINPKLGGERLGKPTKTEFRDNHLPQESYHEKRGTEWTNRRQQKTNSRYRDRNHTPNNRRPVRPIKLFREIQDRHMVYKERNRRFKINEDVEDMDLQVILMNTQTMTASKFQDMAEACLNNKEFSSIFCFTEIKCDGLDFKPTGVKNLYKTQKAKGEKEERSDDRLQR